MGVLSLKNETTPKISFFSVTSTKLWCAATVPVDSFWFYIPCTAYHEHCVCVPLEVLQSLLVNHVLLLLFPSVEMYHLLPFLLLLTSATGDGNFRFTSTHVIVNETPFTQASFGISRTGGQAQPVTLTCQVSTGCQIYYRARLFERLLNSSPRDELGCWCLQSCWSRVML